jgi:hypothetical protein
MRIRNLHGGTALAAAIALAGVVVLAVTGCVQSTPDVIPTSVPSSTPVFASNAAALAAVKIAFGGYLAASDAVAHDGGNNVTRLSKWDSRVQYKRDVSSFAKMAANGNHTTGDSNFSDVSIESSNVHHGTAYVVAYICARIGGTQLLNSSGANVGTGRPLAVPLEVSFISSKVAPNALLVDRSNSWSGTNFCS